MGVTQEAQQTEPMVPNPRRRRLITLLGEVRQQADVLATALDKGAQDMGSGQVWTGTTGSAFQREIEGRKQRLHQQVGRLEGIINAAIAREPEKITTTEARSQHNAYYN